MSALSDARKIKIIFVAAGAIDIISAAAYIIHLLKSIPTLERLSTPVQTDSKSLVQADDRESTVIEPLPLGSLLGYNKPAITPIVMHLGRPPGETDTQNLSSPFSLDGRNWSLGEKMKLKTTLVRVEELWKIVKLHDGDKDGSQ